MSVESADVVIIGGGIQGCSAAWNLARVGVSCILLEKDYVGRHASGVNAGGVRRLGRHLAEVLLAERSSQLWATLDRVLEADTGFRPSRQIKVAETDDDMEGLARRRDALLETGFDHEQLIDQQQLRELLPAISDHCRGGLLVEGDGSAIPYRTTTAFARAAQRHGTRIYQQEPAINIARKGEGWQVHTKERCLHCRYLVNCAGAWGDRIAALVGDCLPLVPTALMLMITQRLPPFVEGVVGSASRTLSFKQFDNGTVLIGGGLKGYADRDKNRATTRLQGLATNAQTACELFPLMRQARLVRSWAGLEGVTSDQIPIIGQGSEPGVIHAFGFSAHGFQLGPVMGEIIASLILSNRSPLPIDAFDPTRFAA